MKRKVIQLAGKTLVVSLPIEWAKKYNVKKGDEINILDEKNKLVITPETTRQETKKIVFDVSKVGYFDRNYISYLYQIGYDEIEIVFNNPSDIHVMKEQLPQLLGFEIISQGKNGCTIKSISEPLSDEFDNILRRTFLLLLELSSSAIEAIKKVDVEALKHAIDLEETNNKFTDFLKRIINKGGYKDYKNTTFMYSIVRDLEKIADYYKYIYKIIKEEKKKVLLSNETLALFEDIDKYLRLFYELFYKFDKEKATKFHKDKDLILAKANDLIKKKSDFERLILYNLIGLCRTTFELYGPYYSMKVQV